MKGMKEHNYQLAHMQHFNGNAYVFDVKQHDVQDLNTAVCRGEWEIKDGGLEVDMK